MKPFEHILVPVDFGDATQAGIDLALSLARAFDARVTLVHACDLALFAATTPFAPAIDLDPILASSEKELERLRVQVCAQWPKTDAVIRHGSPFEEILETARLRGCDLIVIGTHGRRGLARALLGSVAERVVRLATIPVLTAHPRPSAEPAATAA